MDPLSIAGIVLTHEHADHARGACALASRLGVPLVATPGTLGKLPDGDFDRVPLSPGPTHHLDGFDLRLFPVPHDAGQPVGIRLQHGDSTLGLLTDAGRITAEMVEGLRGCDHLLIEANHDPDLLKAGPYPTPLQERIRGGHGHLSNDECGQLLGRVVTSATRRVILTHLSRTNNTPELALATTHALLRRAGRLPSELVAAPPDAAFGPFSF